MKLFKKHYKSLDKLAARLRSPFVSVTIDLLVIFSLLLNAYSLYESARMDKTLNKMDNALNLMNTTLEKTTEDLTIHIKDTYPNILAAHMEATGGMPINSTDNGICTQP